MAVIQKYFLALVPPVEVLEKAHQIKIMIRDQFGMKYALKSPPHITLKMPFNFNEAKEEVLVKKLSEFLKDQKPFQVKIDGVGTFGNRVIFLRIEKSSALVELQSGLKTFCKRELNLQDELSDRNYHPHMTVAFKDLKTRNFDEVLDLVKEQSFQTEFSAEQLMILKRIEHKWIIHRKIHLESELYQ